MALGQQFLKRNWSTNIKAIQTQVLTLGDIVIRQHNSLFSLNDLHAAAGGEERHRPSRWVENQQTQELVQEISKAEIPALITKKGGKDAGTYACRELVIAYASWINAAFHLKVIRVFLDTEAPRLDRTDLTSAQAQELREMVQAIVDAGMQGHGETWARLHRKFRVNSYLRLSGAQYQAARQYLAEKLALARIPTPESAQPQLPLDERTAQDIASLHGQLQQKLLQEIIIPCLTGGANVGQRWIITLAPDDQGAANIALLHALTPDTIISRALPAAPHQQRALALAAYGETGVFLPVGAGK